MKTGLGKKVVVAMSGGVDSSVAAVLLQEQGYQVVGCFMRLGSPAGDAGDGDDKDARTAGAVSTGHQGCCSLNDACDARMVAAMLEVPLYVLNFTRDFDRVIDYFVAEYNAGRTPNPCVRCNDWLKFGKLAAYARSIDAHYIATGHYARTLPDADAPGAVALCRGVDEGKDQSYVLFGTRREELARMMLPIGALHKAEVRDIARRRGLAVADKPDSQEICFVPDNDYAGLIRRRTPQRVAPGDIVDTAGNVVGRHQGHQQFTVGQRRGLGVAHSHPLYVIGKDAQANTVVVGASGDLLCTGLAARDVNWLARTPLPPPGPGGEPLSCAVKVRYHGALIPAKVRGLAGDGMEVHFDQPQAAVAPGQAVVCYQGQRVLGGGWIVAARRGDDGCSG